MTTLCISGACSRSGKTALAATILRALPPGTATALKFTTTEDVFERCPRGTACVVCDIDVPFRILDAEKTLREPGTDTDRLARAGAARVLWVIAKSSAVAAAWGAVRSRLAAGPVVIEGSTVVELAVPTVLLFVVHPFLSPSRWKPTSASLLARADAVIVNRPSAESRPPSEAVMAGIARYRSLSDVRMADVQSPLASWAPDLHEKVLHANLARA